MEKNAIKKYAIWARRELISRVSQKALQYGISEKETVDAEADSVNGKLLTETEKKQRKPLISQIKEKGYEQVMEEVAYTWFNRFSALRFMEVNGYLPTHVRVFTDEDNNFKPQIITEAIHMEMDGLNMDKVYKYKEANKTEELYKYLLITQCNALNKILPGMFQRIEDYTELLFPDNLLREGSVIEQMIAMIPEEDWRDAVQIIGWLYQYYNSEPKDKVFANLKKNIKISKENIPAATQLFTPDWIVRYMVENSLGRLWLEGHPNENLKAKWKYYLDETEQEADVQPQLDKIREEYKIIKPEEIKVIDCCMGSGHILVYAFDVLMQIYESYGYNQREAAKSIVENNLYGLDIDERAAQLAYFAVMMKARQYDRRFLSREAQPHVYAICESNHLNTFCVDYFVNGDSKLKADMNMLIDELHDAKEYGSILNITNVDFDALYARFDKIKDDISMYRESALNDLLPFVQVAQAMMQKYHVIVTNPPYMGASGMNSKLSSYVKKVYPAAKADLSTVFMKRTIDLCRANGFMAMINIPVWMFLSSYEELRKELLEDVTFYNMLHLGRGIFGSDFGTTSFVTRKSQIKYYQGTYRRLFRKQSLVDSIEQKEKWFFEGKGMFFSNQEAFSMISGVTFSYWASEKTRKCFKNSLLNEVADIRSGISTGDNDRFYRLWFEVSNKDISFSSSNTPSNSEFKWFPIIRAGEYRKWWGNRENVLNLQHDAFEIKNAGNNFRLRTPAFYNKLGITWCRITIGNVSFRLKDELVNFGENSPSMFFENNDDALYFLGLLNTKVISHFLSLINPTMTYQVVDISSLPIIVDETIKTETIKLVKECIALAKQEFNDFEVSWDFSTHPLIYFAKQNTQLRSIEDSYNAWEMSKNAAFYKLKENEEKLNRLFITLYGLDSELTPDIEENDITFRKNDLQRDIRSFVSYAVGCMFNRYSLDVYGLAYAGNDWDASKYKTYPIDEDNIIPICDDEYFQDDIVGRFVKFIETVYGADTLEENLQFIADGLGGKGASRDVIRNYFLNNFYKDHCKTYQKRPIYWLFDSGKKNGFKALIYMHRYQPDTLARMRTDYVHEQQARYRTAIENLQERINGASTAERVKLNKQLTKLQDQATELRAYEEKIHHLADQMIRIDLDDGVKHNYEIFKDVLAKIK